MSMTTRYIKCVCLECRDMPHAFYDLTTSLPMPRCKCGEPMIPEDLAMDIISRAGDRDKLAPRQVMPTAMRNPIIAKWIDKRIEDERAKKNGNAE